MTLACFILTGCASNIPLLIENKPEVDLSYESIKSNIVQYKNSHVRWGGKIISVENKSESTWIEILALPLDKFGEPLEEDNYTGRFIASIDGFIDPEHYSKNRNITVYGHIESKIIKKINDHPYEYPFINVNEHYLWPKYRAAHHHYFYYPYPHSYYYHRLNRFRSIYPYYYSPYYRFHYYRR